MARSGVGGWVGGGGGGFRGALHGEGPEAPTQEPGTWYYDLDEDRVPELGSSRPDRRRQAPGASPAAHRGADRRFSARRPASPHPCAADGGFSGGTSSRSLTRLLVCWFVGWLLVGCGQLWLVVVGCGWLWLVVGGWWLEVGGWLVVVVVVVLPFFLHVLLVLDVLVVLAA